VLATALVVAGITFVTIVFGELVPKRIGQLYPEQVSRLIAIPMTWLAKLARPFVWLLAETTQATLKLLQVNNNAQQSVTEEEIEASLAEGVGSGLIESQEHQMVRNVFALDDRSLESIMVPRSDIEWLEATQTVREAMVSAQLHNHSLFPVCKESLDEVVGVIRLADLLDLTVSAPDEAIGNYAMPPTYLPETLTGLELLEQYRESPIRMALVVDEYGVVQGLLTPRDVLEAITGEIKSEESVDDWAQHLGEDEWDLNGLMPANELKARLEIDELPDEEEGTYHTLAGLMLAASGRLMHTGDAIEVADWRFEVVALEGRRIDRVKATRLHKRSDTQD
jgi:putative hemolysin